MTYICLQEVPQSRFAVCLDSLHSNFLLAILFFPYSTCRLPTRYTPQNKRIRRTSTARSNTLYSSIRCSWRSQMFSVVKTIFSNSILLASTAIHARFMALHYVLLRLSYRSKHYLSSCCMLIFLFSSCLCFSNSSSRCEMLHIRNTTSHKQPASQYQPRLVVFLSQDVISRRLEEPPLSYSDLRTLEWP